MSTLTNIGSVVSRTLVRGKLQVAKHSPTILVVAGVGGVVAAGVLACKATLDAQEVFEEHQAGLSIISKATELGEEKYTQEQKTKDLATQYTQTVFKLLRLYAPALIIGGLSLTAILSSHKIMMQRNIALAALYSAAEKQFSEYRKRVADKIGDDIERELYHPEPVLETDDQDVVRVKNSNEYSQYARFYDNGNIHWQRDPELNLFFLKTQQTYANDMLRSRGHVFLNEVYDMLGIPRTKAGAVVGWVLSKTGDNYIDFGIYDIHKEKAREFVNGYELAVLLDFNVDGVIYDLI